MDMYHDSSSTSRSLLSDIADKHCPDSVRQSAYRELESRGISHSEAQSMADERFGDFWG